MRDQVKPKNLGELKVGIKEYWNTLTPPVCRKFIGHLRKVIPMVIEVNAAPLDIRTCCFNGFRVVPYFCNVSLNKF